MNFFNTPKRINNLIKESILQNKPTSFGKIGNVEAEYLNSYLNYSNTINGSQLYVNAGIYTQDNQDYTDWCQKYLKSLESLDYILQWGSSDKQLIKNYFNTSKIFKDFEGLEPFSLGEEGWHYSLKNKKVLCVSPFSKTVLKQSKKYNEIWPGAEIGEVITVSTPHSEALTNQPPISWKLKLKNILEDIEPLKFDFATVGCGGLSLIICDFIKKMGKPSIHLGGGNQLLYGIMGKRWDTAFKDNIWYGTKHWTRPLDEETPKNKNLVENGCYW